MVKLTDAQEALLSQRVEAGEFVSLEEAVTAAIAASTKGEAQERLEALLLDGVRSPSRPWTAEVMNDIRQAARQKL